MPVTLHIAGSSFELDPQLTAEVVHEQLRHALNEFTYFYLAGGGNVGIRLPPASIWAIEDRP